MTIEVIAPPKNKFIVECKNCNCTLSYNLTDITQRTVIDYGGGTDLYNEIRCPSCKYMNTVTQRPLTRNEWMGRVEHGRGYLPDEFPSKDKL